MKVDEGNLKKEIQDLKNEDVLPTFLGSEDKNKRLREALISLEHDEAVLFILKNRKEILIEEIDYLKDLETLFEEMPNAGILLATMKILKMLDWMLSLVT
jgi:hypothetical protein